MSRDLNIAVWNCYRGEPAARLGELSALAPDIAVFTESLSPETASERSAWALHSGKLGTAVVTTGDYTVQRLPAPPDSTPSAVPFRIHGPVSFNLLAVWTFPEPSYSQALRKVIDAYEPFISSGPTVVAGDFNSNPIWDSESKSVNHTINAARIRELGLVSAYHAFTGEAPGAELRPTLYHQWKQDCGFHVDYCFVPESWEVVHAHVAGFESFGTSDHRPLAITLRVAAAAGVRVA